MSHYRIDIPAGYKNGVSGTNWTSQINAKSLLEAEGTQESELAVAFPTLNDIFQLSSIKRENAYQSSASTTQLDKLIKGTILSCQSNDSKQSRSSADNNADKAASEPSHTPSVLQSETDIPLQQTSVIASNSELQQISSNDIFSLKHPMLELSAQNPEISIGCIATSSLGPIPNYCPESDTDIAMPTPIKASIHHNLNGTLTALEPLSVAHHDKNSKEKLNHAAQESRLDPSDDVNKVSEADTLNSNTISSSITTVIESVISGSNNSIQSQNEPLFEGINHRGSRSFLRAPGHEAPTIDDASLDTSILTCNICGFSCTSRFHYNSHMNTHTDRNCPMCTYTARTEGRLRTHMENSHTDAQRQAAGIRLKPKKNASSTQEIETGNYMNSSAQKVCSTTATGDLQSNSGSNIQSTPLEQLKALTEGQDLTASSISATSSTTMLVNSSSIGDFQNDSDNVIQKSFKTIGTKRSGKPKSYKCKQCGHVSKTKEENWEHARTHIPKEKQLTCNQCHFVTEYKHHLEYHILNHFKSKPYQCNKCAYQCVNKSMLNSHMKSHVSDYPFKCQDCAYKTKYCHSLKMHLMKYGHRREPGSAEIDGNDALYEFDPEQMDYDEMREDSISNPMTPAYSDGQVVNQILNQQQQQQANQIPISMEFSGTQLSAGQQQSLNTQQPPSQIPDKAPSEMIRFICPTCNLAVNSDEEIIKHLAIHVLSNQQQSNTPDLQFPLSQLSQQLTIQQLIQQHLNASILGHLGISTDDLNLPLRQNTVPDINASLLLGISNRAEHELIDNNASLLSQLSKIQELRTSFSAGNELMEQNRYHASVLEPVGLYSTESKESAECNIMECGTSSDGQHDSPNSETRKSRRKNSLHLLGKNSPDNSKTSTESHDQEIEVQVEDQSDGMMPFSCQHCMIDFKDEALYQIHLGYHGFGAPFKCNRCGHVSENSLEFNIHLYQAKHSG